MYLTNQKKAAIELSISTVVIIVLAMTMLILGLVLVRSIFTGATDSVKSIDRGVKNEINKLFSEDNTKILVLIPDSKLIRLKQGSFGEGFAISIRNTGSGSGVEKFGYKVSLADSDLQTKCGTSNNPIEGPAAWAKIDAGRELNALNGISLNRGNAMDDPVHVRFTVSDTSPICLFRLKVEITKDTQANIIETKFMDVEITPK